MIVAEGRQLTKKERKALARKLRLEKQDRQQRSGKIKNLLVIGVTAALVLGIGGWLWQSATRPLPGEEVAELGREHVTDISNVIYNSNPPTSGPHFPVWVKQGVYDWEISDGYLLHSLEHGYVIISYNCEKNMVGRAPVVAQILAHEDEVPHEEPPATPSAISSVLSRMTPTGDDKVSWYTPDNPPPKERELSPAFTTEECSQEKSELTGLLKDYERLIIVPRTDMETTIAVTAWGRIETMEKIDLAQIRAFTSAFENQGPEKTEE
ncbi:MAG: hypothetical protein A2900_01730 [Candidatus Chisholmbacteria bacterium RIFCSPLOWO2_01_FULL_50_28]|uniref:DUF3105 domain-containing protein n=1 Tax=Candidatus Chisholmbacteria bacterium RIFCSPHIGHO2_01_FULL_52_32 TaxID=1797591 RepID=A0A1G1VU31_9BACT|nr:MAG: hypothetical protein A2786_05015 [Candidatus Chisholmbacteria bacterium RIFCSPHIGHO2_01_FULL_52_32]OGY19806.1 MAG: hypothetical protein A2900_01730 [Candidatus Chisholmbacteria bacterium RIFCSPLOWO2_01_FULL_50_28]